MEKDGLMMKYFVLQPHKNNAYGNASRSAIKQYADEIAFDNPELAKDLHSWVNDIESSINSDVRKGVYSCKKCGIILEELTADVRWCTVCGGYLKFTSNSSFIEGEPSAKQGTEGSGS